MSLLIEGLHARQGRVHVLHGLNLEVASGTVVALLGRNGMGKTTLAHAAMGMIKPFGGTVTLDGKNITGLAPERINRFGLALMPQGHRVFAQLSVGENLAVAQRGATGADAWTIDRALDRLPLLRERWSQRSNTLSGGEQQMLTMARALVSNPKYVILDEPAEGLAPAIVDSFADIIHELRLAGTGVLLIEQRVEYAIGLADRVCVVSRGKEVFEGTPEEFSENDIRAEHIAI